MVYPLSYKKCTLCKEEKLGIEFNYCRRSKDYLTTRCKKCLKELSKKQELSKLRKIVPGEFCDWRKY